MREIHKITLTGFNDLTKRSKAIDIISAALVKEFARKVAVSPEGFMSDAVIHEMPSSTSVFLICNEAEPEPDTERFLMDAQILQAEEEIV